MSDTELESSRKTGLKALLTIDVGPACRRLGGLFWGRSPAGSWDESQRHWNVLAFLRFVLAIVVSLYHIDNNIPSAKVLTPFVGSLGFPAVLAFLIVSGYSITASLEREPQHFYRRRFDRIYPIYLACLLIAYIPFLIWGNNLPTLRATLYTKMNSPLYVLQSAFTHLLMIDALIGWRIQTFHPAWSLHLEVLFYACAPLFVRGRSLVLLILSGLSWGYFALGPTYEYPVGDHGPGVLALAWAWLTGMVFYRRRTVMWAKLALIAGSALLWPAGLGAPAMLFYAAACATIAFADRLPVLWPSLMNSLGDVSYPLYLVHMPLLIVLSCMGIQSWPLYVLTGLLVAWLLYRLVDLPYRAYVRRRKVRELLTVNC